MQNNQNTSGQSKSVKMDKETNTEPDYVLANGQDGATPVPQAAEIDKQKMHALSQAEAVPVDMYMMPPKKEGHKCEYHISFRF